MTRTMESLARVARWPNAGLPPKSTNSLIRSSMSARDPSGLPKGPTGSSRRRLLAIFSPGREKMASRRRRLAIFSLPGEIVPVAGESSRGDLWPFGAGLSGIRDRCPGGGLVGGATVVQQPLGLGVHRLDGLFQVERLAERLPYVALDAQIDLAAVALGVEEVDAVGVAVGDFLLDGDALCLEPLVIGLQRLHRVHPPGDLVRQHR